MASIGTSLSSRDFLVVSDLISDLPSAEGKGEQGAGAGAGAMMALPGALAVH